MLEWKTITLEHKSFIGMHIMLPKQPIFIITSTKCTLLGRMFHLQKMNPAACYFIMEKSDNYHNLLRSHVIKMSERAKRDGYQLGMSGKEVLLYAVSQETKTKV